MAMSINFWSKLWSVIPSWIGIGNFHILSSLAGHFPSTPNIYKCAEWPIYFGTEAKVNCFSISYAKQCVMGQIDKIAMAGEMIPFSEHDLRLGPEDCLWKLGMQTSHQELAAWPPFGRTHALIR